MISMLDFPTGVTTKLRMVLKQLEVCALSNTVTANAIFKKLWNCVTLLFWVSHIPFCPGLNVRELINPSKTAEEVEGEAQEGQKAYTHSYNAYLVGKKNKKKYVLFIRPLLLQPTFYHSIHQSCSPARQTSKFELFWNLSVNFLFSKRYYQWRKPKISRHTIGSELVMK